MAGSDREVICYEAASWLEHDIAPLPIAWGAALVAAVSAATASVGRALKRLAGSAGRRRADGAHPSATRST
jgi:hypothetical protein